LLYLDVADILPHYSFWGYTSIVITTSCHMRSRDGGTIPLTGLPHFSLDWKL
jgi:hypothetical protein